MKNHLHKRVKKSNFVSKLTSGRSLGNQSGHIETYGNTEGYDAFMPREQNSNVLFYCQSNAAITPYIHARLIFSASGITEPL